MTRFTAPIAEQIWDMKYRLKDADGTPIDTSVEDTWRRIARALAEVEDDPATWEARFYEALEGFKAKRDGVREEFDRALAAEAEAQKRLLEDYEKFEKELEEFENSGKKK